MSSYIPIASQTLGSSAASVTFSSIPTTLNGKTLRDLVLVCNIFGTSSSNTIEARTTFNGDTNANYFFQVAAANGGSLGATQSNNNYIVPVYAKGTSTQALNAFFNIMDFAQTNKHKLALYRANTPQSGSTVTVAEMGAGRWANTSAITSITISSTLSANFNMGSTFNLFGVEG